MNEKNVVKKGFYVALFAAALYFVSEWCCMSGLHRGDIGAGVGYFRLLALQALLTWCAAKVFFTNAAKEFALGVNAAISTALMFLVFVWEVPHHFAADAPFGSVLQAMLDPGMFLLHISYGALIYIVFKAVKEWWPQDMRKAQRA